MKDTDLAILLHQLKKQIISRQPPVKLAIVGWTPVAIDIVAFLRSANLLGSLSGIYDPNAAEVCMTEGLIRKQISDLVQDKPELIIIAEDEEKEVLLEMVAPLIDPMAQILIGGYGHFSFKDRIFDHTLRELLIPSFANGYPNCLIHIYQCLRAAARRQLKGVVVEFGMFKGGTTMLISKFIEKLDVDWRVFGFDTFDGFPPRRSALDMYAHPDCVFPDLPLVKKCFEGRNVEIVAGDVVKTAELLREMPIVLAFVDTDNYTSAAKILEVIMENVVPGGAVVFDHYTGRDRHLYTIGERIAAKRLAQDVRYFNLHETGVFLRLG